MRGKIMSIGDLRRSLKRLQASHLGSIIVASSFLTLCWVTLDNGVCLNELKGYIDPIDLAFALSGHRLAYSTGYPFFTLLGWLWYQVGRLLFFLNPTERLALFSTLQAIGALIFMYATLLTLLKGNVLIAGLTSLLFAFTKTFWTTSNTLEVYPLNLLLVTLIIWLLMRWGEERADRCLPWVGLLFGIGLAHHRTIVLLMPAVALFVLLVNWKVIRKVRLLTLFILAALSPLLTYLYLPIRASLDPSLTAHAPNPWRWSWQVIWATDYQRDLVNPLFAPSAFVRELTTCFQMQARELSVWGLLLGWLGLALLFDRERRRWGAFFTTAYLCYFYFGAVYTVYDRKVMIMPAFMFLAMGVGVVADRVWRLSEVLSGSLRRLAQGAMVLLLVAPILGQLVIYFPSADQRDLPSDDGLLAAQKIVSDNPEPGATILSSYEEGLSLEYYTMVWERRKDLKIAVAGEELSLPPPGDYITCSLAKYLWAERLAPYHPSAVGVSLLRLSSSPRCGDINMKYPHKVIYEGKEGGRMALLGYDLERTLSAINLTLYWRGEERMDKDYSVFVHLVGEGEIISQADSRHPVCGSFPTSQISPGELIRDAHELPLPSHYRGPFTILVGLYDLEDPQMEKLRGMLPTGEGLEAVTIKAEP